MHGGIGYGSKPIPDLSNSQLALDALNDESALILNLGNGEGYSVKEVIETAREVTGHEIPAQAAARRPGDGPSLVADAARARDVLGWEPQTPDLAEIIASAWAWHQAHPDGYNGA